MSYATVGGAVVRLAVAIDAAFVGGVLASKPGEGIAAWLWEIGGTDSGPGTVGIGLTAGGHASPGVLFAQANLARRTFFIGEATVAAFGRTPIAIIGTFAASALLHFWVTLAAAGQTMAASMAAYFLIQGALVLAERALAVRHWQNPLQRAWTAGCLLLPLPLLLDPLLAITFG